ncbi:MAG: DUF2752 domain-containing protein [Ruminococcus sp.]|nr:DUF2752 domain-containing protein [Ruminococcus sp.]
MKSLNIKRAAVISILPVITAVLFMTRELWTALAERFPECVFYISTGYYCPACGNTRSVLALLRGDLLSALSYNITPPLLLLGALLLYAELLCSVFGRSIRLLPRKGAFWIVFGVCMLAYYIIRNFAFV